MRLPNLDMDFSGDDCRDLLVKVAKARREAPLAKQRDPGDERVVKGRQEPGQRYAFACDPLQLCWGNRVGDPLLHEPGDQGSNLSPRPAFTVYLVEQTSTSSKNSPARRPVRRLTCRVSLSSRDSPDRSTI